MNKNMKSKEELRVSALEDEAAIRTLVTRFADACIVADYDAFQSLWSANGKWTIHEPFFASGEGMEKIVEMMRMLRTGRSFFVQFAHSGVVMLEGDKATARWVMHEASKGPGEVHYNNYGLYVDILIKIDGRRLFTQIDYLYMWIDSGAFPGDAYVLPALSNL